MDEEIDKIIRFFGCETAAEVLKLEEEIINGLKDQTNSDDTHKIFEELYEKLEYLKKHINESREENSQTKHIINESKQIFSENDTEETINFNSTLNLFKRVKYPEDSFEKCLLDLEKILEGERELLNKEEVYKYHQKSGNTIQSF